MKQSHNQHSYTRLDCQPRSSPQLHTPTAASTLTSVWNNVARSHEPLPKLDDYWLNSEKIDDDDVPPPVPPKDIGQTLPPTQPRGLRPFKPDDTARGRGNQSTLEQKTQVPYLTAHDGNMR